MSDTSCEPTLQKTITDNSMSSSNTSLCAPVTGPNGHPAESCQSANNQAKRVIELERENAALQATLEIIQHQHGTCEICHSNAWFERADGSKIQDCEVCKLREQLAGLRDHIANSDTLRVVGELDAIHIELDLPWSANAHLAVRNLCEQLREAELKLTLWSATFQKYESWQANKIKWIDVDDVVVDFKECARIAKEKPARDSVTAGGVVIQRMVRPLERLSTSIYAIVALYDAGELTEGQATKLMNCGDRVSWRLRREQIHAEMKELLTKDVESHGWKWPNDQAHLP